MLTIRIMYEDGCESVVECTSVNVGEKNSNVTPKVYFFKPGEAFCETIDRPAKVFVMNENGNTVAKYHIVSVPK